MSLSRIPTTIPFELGAQESLPVILPYGLTNLTPMFTLPQTLSAKEEFEDVPYGSVGWEIVCKSHTDFQSIIFRTSDMAPPTFSRELSGTGLASVNFDLDHYAFNNLLINGRPVEDLFDYENLWEIYFDKKLRFQFLGTAVSENPIGANEIRSASVSGNGIAQVLSWASVYPANFPDIIRKLETLSDDFNDDRINSTVWTRTNTTQGGLDLSRSGQKEDILKEIEDLTSQKESQQEDLVRANADLAAEKADYAAVYKNASSTTAQKTEATAQLAKATADQKKAAVSLAATNILLSNANAKSALAPNIVQDDNTSRVKMTITSSGQSKEIGAGPYDFVSSGISARIEPLIQGSGTGQAVTTMLIKASSSAYARFYTQSISNSRRLVAEVNDNGEVVNEDFSYDPNTHAYWRIREDHGSIIFDTSSDNTNWLEKFRVYDVSWVAQPVDVYFQTSLQGNSGVNPPLSAYVSTINSEALPAVEAVMANFLEQLTDAQNRGTITYVDPIFTEYKDSAGATWVGKPNVTINEGTNLLDLLKSFASLQQFDWLMDNDFQLKAYQKVWNDDETDPTLSFHKEGSIVFHEGNSQLVRSRTRDRSEVANAIVGKNSAGQYAYMEDTESISKFQRREVFIEAGSAPDLNSLGTMLEASLEEVKDEKSSWKLQVVPDLPGKRVFDDYDVGDWVGVEMIDSTGVATKNAWRIVGIAIQVDENGQTVAELTLQSRRELLIERLQAQVSSTTSSSSSITLGSAVSAATLIQQAKLANLLDVLVPAEDQRTDGDVLTWQGSYFTLTTPGDHTIPEAPVIQGVQSNVYYPESGISTKAQIQITWSTPLNTDGSTITDGHHYEIRYKPDTTLPYSATWLEANQHDWNELYYWNQPTIPPIANTGWQSVTTSFEDNEIMLQEMSPGVKYEIQVRAVDSSTPQHFGEWSESVIHEAAEDAIPPAQPAAPLIASSMVAFQVTHYLGSEGGSDFDLPPDMDHLEVHVGGPSFYPDETTYVGKIIANVSIIRGRTPVIQTFQVDTTENIWVRVIAVDRTGNKSTPSKAATTQVNLIDDAHISDLTASKITAGTISSSIILSGVIKTAESGPRAEMNFEGFRIYGEEEEATVSLLGNPTTDGNFLLIKDPTNTTATLAGIDGTGRGSFQSITVSDDITIQGEDLMGDILDPRPKGVISIGTYTTPVLGAGIAVERGFLEISFIAEEARTYMIVGVTEFKSTSSSNERLVMRLRDGGDQAPTVATPFIQQSITSLVGSSGFNSAAQIIYAGTFTPGLHRILWTFYGQIGNATVSASASGGSVDSTTVFWVEDVGLPKTDTLIVNDGGVAASGSGTTLTPDAKPAPKVEYTKSYSCTWSGTYRSNGELSSSHGNEMVQGNSGDGWLGDARSLAGFDYAAIQRDLKGATIKSCYVTLYANHWYWNDGGTARIGTHNYTSRPGSSSLSRINEQRVTSSSWPKPGKRKVSLGTTIGAEFQSGASKGISLGPTNGDKRQYGRFNGNGQSNEPVLTITYVK